MHRRSIALFASFALVSAGCGARAFVPPTGEDACVAAYQAGAFVASKEEPPVPKTAPPALVAQHYPGEGEEARCFEEGFAHYVTRQEAKSGLTALVWITAPIWLLIAALYGIEGQS